MASANWQPQKIKTQAPSFDGDRYQTEQYFATSADGTKVPYFVVLAKDAQRTGRNPTHIFAYGGFRNALTPSYSGSYEDLSGASWMAEYGDPDSPAEWAYISAYSPYHNLKAGVDYPAVFFYTSTRDDRVHPGHARKMAARMQAMGQQVRYYENIEGGHGGSTTNDQLAYRLGEHVDLDGTRSVEGGAYLFLYLDRADPDRAAAIVNTVNASWAHGRAHLPGDTPASWQVDDNPSFADVILMPEAGYAVLSSREKAGTINAGDHGWAPEAPAMHGFFVACGPNITPGVSPGQLKTIDIHPLMLAIIGLKGPAPTAGDASKLADFLYTERSNQSCLQQ